jgi:thiamine kinase-like enzyme
MRREIAAAVALAADLGIRCDEPRIVNEGFNLLLELCPEPVLARIPTAVAEIRDPLESARSELAFAALLAESGIEAARPSTLVPPGPHRLDGLVISFWELERRISRPLDVKAAAHSLRRIHDLDPRRASFLPPFRPLLELDLLLERIEARRLLAVEDLELLESEKERLVPLLPERFDERPLHGDAHFYNIMESARGTIWIDLEDGCLGPIEWDLATLQAAARRLEQDLPWRAAIAAYGREPDTDLLELMVELRGVYVAAWHALGAATIPESALWRDRWLELLREDRANRGRS